MAKKEARFTFRKILSSQFQAVTRQAVTRQAVTRQRAWLLILLLISGTFLIHAFTTGATTGASQNPTFAQHSKAADFAMQAKATAGFPASTPAASAPGAFATPTTTAPATTAPTTATSATTTASGPIIATTTLDRHAVLRGGEGRVRMELSLQAPHIEDTNAPSVASDLVVILDHSGSMAGEKIVQARQAAQDLISRLTSQDRFALVAFASDARLLIKPARATSENRRLWHRTIDQLQANGSTDMAAGLDLARTIMTGQLRERSARVMLLSDGHPDSEDGLRERAANFAHLAAPMSALGIGIDFNEVLMAHLADAGTGNYYYLRDADAIAQVFANELSAGRLTFAQDLRIHLRPALGVHVVDFAGYPTETTGDIITIRPGQLFSGQQRRLWLTFQVPTGDTFEARSIADFDISYNSRGQALSQPLPTVARVDCVASEEQALAAINRDTWERSVVENAYGGLQKEIAALIRQGKRSEAQSHIQNYQSEVSLMNAVVGSQEVEEHLEASKKLSSQVDDAFRGANQAAKQKQLTKEVHDQFNELQRLGSKYEGGGR